MNTVGDISYTYFVTAPYTRIRTVIEHERGSVIRFLISLEYNVADDVGVAEEWVDVARFDHNPEGVDGHDIQTEGLHLDLHVPGGEDRRSWDFKERPVDQTPDFCQNYLEDHEEAITKQFCYAYGFENWNQPTSR